MSLKMNLVWQRGQHPGISIWIQALRLLFVPSCILPALLGSIIAWSRFREFNFWYFHLVIVGVTVHHIGLNMIGDVFDYRHAVDRSHGEEKNPYTGGSGVLAGGLRAVCHVLTAAICCYIMGIVIAIYLTLARTAGFYIPLLRCYCPHMDEVPDATFHMFDRTCSYPLPLNRVAILSRAA